MPLTVVRIIATRQLVGIYASADTQELCTLVDELCTPCDCEFAFLPNGGVAVLGATSPTLPLRDRPATGGSSRGSTLPTLSPTVAIDTALHDQDLIWQALDPMLSHPGSQLDALLSTPSGRAHLAALYQKTGSISLSKTC